jgi:ABC-type uncharacterized transport system substrate-binding protein
MEEATMTRHHIGLLITLALAILVAPLAAEAQPPGKVYRIGYLGTDPPLANRWEALLDGLREHGYREGQNLVFERRFSEGNAARFPELAAELVRLRVDCILVPTTPAALAAKHATQTIPIVILTAIDPVGAGLVASLARPGGNLTGLSVLAPELIGKRMKLLQEVVPGMTRRRSSGMRRIPPTRRRGKRRRWQPARWVSASTRRTCGARRTLKAPSPA